MGLVQVLESDFAGDANILKAGQATLVWDAEIESLVRRFGPLVIDHVNYFIGSDFMVSLEGISC